MEGSVLSGVGGFYTVLTETGDRYTLRAQGKLRRQRLTPMVGDRVRFQPGEGDQHGWLEAILPRRNQLIRPPVANIDRIAIVVSAGTPEPDLMLVDRMLIFAKMNEIKPVVVVNKCDEDSGTAEEIALQYAGTGAEVFRTCAETGDGLEQLRQALRGTIHALGGQSGVGKSTLINKLYGLDRETGSLSEKIERGKNTTRHCELIPLEGGGMVLDTPGFSLLELNLMDPVELRHWMPEFDEHEGNCRFQPCVHVSEPGCSVRAAVADGRIPEQRWERYKALHADMTQRWRERYD
ncbi:MAG: ribosome small subunit-dependent GTPase A [Clostridia bacterium]|nr:ribosome small subunit-dependent GTPase A [Clostridia bacterium]